MNRQEIIDEIKEDVVFGCAGCCDKADDIRNIADFVEQKQREARVEVAETVEKIWEENRIAIISKGENGSCRDVVNYIKEIIQQNKESKE